MARILVINGPNLNLLGQREPGIYGHETLADLIAALKAVAANAGHTLDDFQSNSEDELVARIQKAAGDGSEYLLCNVGAFTHTSIAIRDALLAAAKPFIEVHISNIHAREAFRHKSYLSDIAAGVIVGLGVYGYELALGAAIRALDQGNA